MDWCVWGINQQICPQTETFTLYRSNPKDANSLSNDFIYALEPQILEDGTFILWIGSEDGLNRVEPQTEKFTRYRHESSNASVPGRNIVQSLAFSAADNTLWIGTMAGLCIFDDPTQPVYRQYDADRDIIQLLHNGIYDIAQDQQGVLWICTNSELIWLNPATEEARYYVNNPNIPTSLSNNSVFTVYLDQNDGVWVGTWAEGVNYFTPYRFKFQLYLGT